MNNEKMIKMAKTIDKISKVFQKIAGAMVIVCAILIPLVLIFKEKMITDIDSLEIGNFVFELNKGFEPTFEQIQPGIIATLISGIIIAFVLWFGFKVFRHMLQPMKEGLPFDDRMPEDLKKMGWLVIAGGLGTQVVKMIAETVLISEYNLKPLLNGEAVSGVSISYSIDFTIIFIGVLLFFMARIFAYGAQLQKESDETL